MKKVLSSKDGVCRVFQWLLALIAFASMASQDNYDHYSSFKFLVFVGVMVWLITPALLVSDLFQLAHRYDMLDLARIGYDSLFAFWSFSAAVAVAAKCSGKFDDGSTVCSTAKKARTAAAFMFLVCFLFFATLVLSWSRYKKYAS